MNVKQVINYILCGFKSLNLNLLNLQKLCCLCFCFHNWAELTFLRLSCVVIKENSIKSLYLEFISSKMLSSIKIINIKVSLRSYTSVMLKLETSRAQTQWRRKTSEMKYIYIFICSGFLMREKEEILGFWTQ